MPDSVACARAFTYIPACLRGVARTYTRARIHTESGVVARLSLIHIHQTLINHRPAHPRRATPLAGHEAGKKIRARLRGHLHILRATSRCRSRRRAAADFAHVSAEKTR